MVLTAELEPQRHHDAGDISPAVDGVAARQRDQRGDRIGLSVDQPTHLLARGSRGSPTPGSPASACGSTHRRRHSRRRSTAIGSDAPSWWAMTLVPRSACGSRPAIPGASQRSGCWPATSFPTRPFRCRSARSLGRCSGGIAGCLLFSGPALRMTLRQGASRSLDSGAWLGDGDQQRAIATIFAHALRNIEAFAAVERDQSCRPGLTRPSPERMPVRVGSANKPSTPVVGSFERKQRGNPWRTTTRS